MNSAVHPLPTQFTPVDDIALEHVDEKGGVYIRSYVLRKAGYVIPQHSHDHDHATFVGAGSVRAWCNGVWIGDIPAGHAIEIKAGTQHVFQSLEDNTRLACVHDARSAMSVKEKGI